MKKILIINEGILDGDSMRMLIKILPELDGHFKSRKGFDEYYNDLHDYEKNLH